MKTLLKTALRIVAAPFHVFAQPWINARIIADVRTQMEFWHRVETAALHKSFTCELRGDYKGVLRHLEEARTARLRCEKEMSRLPYTNRRKTCKRAEDSSV